MRITSKIGGLVGLLGLFGCDSKSTGLDVQLSYSLQIVEVEVSGTFDDGTDLAPRRQALETQGRDGADGSLVILLPDEFGGRTLTLRISGYTADDRLGVRWSGNVRVTEGEVIPLSADLTPQCGDGLILTPEICDDRNRLDRDGCSSACIVEDGWTCSGNPSDCNPIINIVCGDGRLEGDEDCDDGNLITDPIDGCNENCQIEDGWFCNQLSPTECIQEGILEMCGNGTIDPPERCDDGDRDNLDGCSALCDIEPGWECDGASPTTCEKINPCGNGVLEAPEACDDGNNTLGDGCDVDCNIEPNAVCYDEPSVCLPADQVVFVDSNGPSCPGEPDTGTQADPYCTIGAGATALRQGRVVVMAGDYVEKVNLDGADYDLDIVTVGQVTLSWGMPDALKIKGGGRVSVSDMTITGVDDRGGGIKVETAGSVAIFDNLRIGPSGETGLEVKTGDASIRNSWIIGNPKGGIELNGGGEHHVTNCVMALNGDNMSEFGGLYVADTSDLSTLVNNTIADNVSKSDKVAGVRCNVDIALYNTIVWNNPIGSDTGVEEPCVPNYSNLSDDYEGVGVGNFTADPLFIDANYRITTSSITPSPCLDRGDPTGVQPDGPAPDFDFEGDPRPQGAAVDVGADEAG